MHTIMAEYGVVQENRFVCYCVLVASELKATRGILTRIILVFGSGGIILMCLVISLRSSSSRVCEVVRVRIRDNCELYYLYSS